MNVLSSRFVSLAALVSASALGCGGVVYLDKDPGDTPDGSAPSPTSSTSAAPSNTTPAPVIPVAPPGTCDTTPKELARVPGSAGVSLSAGTGFVAVVVVDRTSPLTVVRHDLYVVPHGKAATSVAQGIRLGAGAQAVGGDVYYGSNVGLERYTTSDASRETFTPEVNGPFAVTGSSVYVAEENTRSIPPVTAIVRRDLSDIGLPPVDAGSIVGQVRSLSALGNEWGAVLAEGKVAQGLVGFPSTLADAPNATGPGAVTKAGFYFHEKPSCATSPTACTRGRVSALPPAGSLATIPGFSFTYEGTLYSDIQAFYADGAGFVMHAALSDGTEIRARETILSHRGPGGAFEERVADTTSRADAIAADASCIYWIETDRADPSPSASATVLKSVRRFR